jgi:hypothetical protein
VLLSTHHLEEVVAYCHSVGLMEEGELIDAVDLRDRRARFRARVSDVPAAVALLRAQPWVREAQRRGDHLVASFEEGAGVERLAASARRRRDRPVRGGPRRVRPAGALPRAGDGGARASNRRGGVGDRSRGATTGSRSPHRARSRGCAVTALLVMEFGKLARLSSVRFGLVVLALFPWLWAYAPGVFDVYGFFIVSGFQVPALSLLSSMAFLLPLLVAIAAAELLGIEIQHGTLPTVLLRPSRARSGCSPSCWSSRCSPSWPGLVLVGVARSGRLVRLRVLRRGHGPRGRWPAGRRA